jgi:hypothetical protein
MGDGVGDDARGEEYCWLWQLHLMEQLHSRGLLKQQASARYVKPMYVFGVQPHGEHGNRTTLLPAELNERVKEMWLLGGLACLSAHRILFPIKQEFTSSLTKRKLLLSRHVAPLHILCNTCSPQQSWEVFTTFFS